MPASVVIARPGIKKVEAIPGRGVSYDRVILFLDTSDPFDEAMSKYAAQSTYRKSWSEILRRGFWSSSTEVRSAAAPRRL